MCVEDETKIVNGSVLLHGGVKLVVAYPPSGGAAAPSSNDMAVDGSISWSKSGNAWAGSEVMRQRRKVIHAYTSSAPPT